MGKRIVIIDDNQDILELLAMVFRNAGHSVVYSQGALDIAYIKAFSPDLILLDVIIQNIPARGAELCQNLKSDEQTSNIPVVLCSAETNLDKIAADCQADFYIAKPYDFTRLLSQLDKFLKI